MNFEIIDVTGAGSELQGVGHLSDGRAVFIPGALPGERVKAEITKSSKRFCEARLLSVEVPSPDRTDSLCPYSGKCGGCQGRHMQYAYTLELKRQRVYDALCRIGSLKDPVVRPTLGCSVPERYRNKGEFAIHCHGETVTAGGMDANGKRIVPFKDCLLQKEGAIRVLNRLTDYLPAYPLSNHIRGLVTRVNRMGRISVTLTSDAPIQSNLTKLAEALQKDVPDISSVYLCVLKPRPVHALDGTCFHIRGDKVLRDTILGLSFELSPQSFFQINPETTDALYKTALNAADLSPSSRVLDIYCGAGTITLNAAKNCAYATGVEIVAPAIENAKKNAQLNGLSERSRFLCGAAEKVIPQLIAKGERYDTVILDPPRKGADAAVLEAIIKAAIPSLVYVSCDPATLSRDLKLLTGGGYVFEWAQPVDMFPWTGHVETVVLLSHI